MAKWRHITITPHQPLDGYGWIYIFPSSRFDAAWLFEKFPKIKKHRRSTNSLLVIDTEPHPISDVLVWIWHYLEENGWECCAENTFKRQEN